MDIDQAHQLFSSQPARVTIAGVGKTFGQRTPTRPVRRAPPLVRGLDHVEIVELDGVAGFVFRDQDFVELLARADAHDLHITSGRQGARHVSDLHARDLGDEYLATMHRLDRLEDELYALFQREPEAGHASVCHGHAAAILLLREEHWHHTAAAAEDVAV